MPEPEVGRSMGAGVDQGSERRDTDKTALHDDENCRDISISIVWGPGSVMTHPRMAMNTHRRAVATCGLWMLCPARTPVVLPPWSHNQLRTNRGLA